MFPYLTAREFSKFQTVAYFKRWKSYIKRWRQNGWDPCPLDGHVAIVLDVYLSTLKNFKYFPTIEFFL